QQRRVADIGPAVARCDTNGESGAGLQRPGGRGPAEDGQPGGLDPGQQGGRGGRARFGGAFGGAQDEVVEAVLDAGQQVVAGGVPGQRGRPFDAGAGGGGHRLDVGG